MQIRRTTNVQATNAVNLQTQNKTQSTNNQVSAPVDQLEFSAEAQRITQANSMADIRMDRVNELRAQIADGSYDTPERMEAAVNRLLDELG